MNRQEAFRVLGEGKKVVSVDETSSNFYFVFSEDGKTLLDSRGNEINSPNCYLYDPTTDTEFKIFEESKPYYKTIPELLGEGWEFDADGDLVHNNFDVYISHVKYKYLGGIVDTDDKLMKCKTAFEAIIKESRNDTII